MKIGRRASRSPKLFRFTIAPGLVLISCGKGLAVPACPAERDAPLVPDDLPLCASLEETVRKPDALPLALAS
jgi:hypothetical protein